MQAAERELLDGEFAPGMPRRFSAGCQHLPLKAKDPVVAGSLRLFFTLRPNL